MDLASNMRELIGLGRGSIDFKNKEQLESARNAIVDIGDARWDMAAYFDDNGRYSYGRQPEAALWALTQLGKSLDQFIDEKIIIEILNQFSNNFHISLKKHFL